MQTDSKFVGLKQASRAWNQCFTKFLRKFNLEPLHSDNCIFVKRDKDKAAKLIIAIYVDDGLVCSSSSKDELQAVLDHLSRKFEITVVDPKCFLGFEIKRNHLEKSSISQTHYMKKVLERFGMSDAKPA